MLSAWNHWFRGFHSDAVGCSTGSSTWHTPATLCTLVIHSTTQLVCTLVTAVIQNASRCKTNSDRLWNVWLLVEKDAWSHVSNSHRINGEVVNTSIRQLAVSGSDEDTHTAYRTLLPTTDLSKSFEADINHQTANTPSIYKQDPYQDHQSVQPPCGSAASWVWRCGHGRRNPCWQR